MTARRRSQRLIDAGLARPTATSHPDILNRSTEMQLMHEDLARAHAQQRVEEAIRHARVHRLVAAHRAARRAERASMRARRLLASAIVG